MKAFNKRERALAIITSCVIFGVIVYNVILNPQLEHRQTLLSNMRQLQLDLTKMKADILLKDSIDRTYSQIEPLISVIGNRQEEIGLFSSEIGGLYKSLSVEPRTMTINPVVTEEYYSRLSISMEMIGNIKDIIKFIYCVETHPNPIRIERLEIIPREINDNVLATFLLTKVIVEPEL